MTMKNEALSETEKDQILTVDAIRNFNDLKFYYKQRLGADFDKLPGIKINPEDFYELTTGDNPLLAEAMEKLNEAVANDMLMVWYDYGILLTFHIERPTVGNDIANYIKEHMQTPLHQEFFWHISETLVSIQKLHFKWKSSEIEYHKIVMPYRKKEEKNDDVDPLLDDDDYGEGRF